MIFSDAIPKKEGYYFVWPKTATEETFIARLWGTDPRRQYFTADWRLGDCDPATVQWGDPVSPNVTEKQHLLISNRARIADMLGILREIHAYAENDENGDEIYESLNVAKYGMTPVESHMVSNILNRALTRTYKMIGEIDE